MVRFRLCAVASVALLLVTGCGGGGKGIGVSGDSVGIPDHAGDSAADAAPEVLVPGDELPDSLPQVYTRDDTSTPVSDKEITAFTEKILGFLVEVRYFDYLLYTTHGVDASTGMKDWQFWYNERFRREGDLVTFYHPENLNDGGHNLHIPLSRVLGDVIAAYLLVNDDTMGLAAQQLCKGMSASMLGMQYDEDDPLPHLMSRNVVAFNHEFLTHDGKRKAVDYSGWYSEYERWNCSRFPYEKNPKWGITWVTSMRSKDDICHIFRLIPNLRYVASRAQNPGVRDACGEALTLLEAFAKDIVDSDYRVRTKDKHGEAFMPGFTGDPEVDQFQGDLSSFIHYRDAIPGAECNNRRAAELIGYHEAIAEDCGRGEPNFYDAISFELNRYNKRICRYFHLAHIANAWVNRDDNAAMLLLDGLEERMALEFATPEDKMQYAPEDWRRNLALYLIQSQAFGYPLTWDEVRLIHTYYGKGADRMGDWPYWDPWAPELGEVDGEGYRPPSCQGDGDAKECWFRVEDMAQLFETCWSPFTNPTGARYVDCDLVRSFVYPARD